MSLMKNNLYPTELLLGLNWFLELENRFMIANCVIKIFFLSLSQKRAKNLIIEELFSCSGSWNTIHGKLVWIWE